MAEQDVEIVFFSHKSFTGPTKEEAI